MGSRQGEMEGMAMSSSGPTKDLSVLEGKTVLVTGHTGFKGGWLSLWLDALGARVVGYSLDPPTTPSFFEATHLSTKMRDLRNDILDLGSLRHAIMKYNPIMVFHLAAQSLVLESYESPAVTFNTNVMGTVNVLEAVRKSTSVRACICVTSDKCYENRGWVWGYREIDPMGGYDPYSGSKGAAELAIASYRNSYFEPKSSAKAAVAISSARAGNVVGGGDWAKDRIVPDCYRALISNRRILLRNPDTVRPWQFVLEPLYGYLLLAINMIRNPTIYSGAWNFGPDRQNHLTVKDLVKEVVANWGSGNWNERRSRGRNCCHEAKALALDSSKANDILQWAPVYSFKESIKETVDWYRAYADETEDMHRFTRKQINAYLNRMKSKAET